MKKVKVDLLVIGNILCSSYATCIEFGHMCGAGGTIPMDPEHIPDSVELFGMQYDLRNVIVIDATSKPLFINSILSPEGKAVFVSGCVIASAYGPL